MVMRPRIFLPLLVGLSLLLAMDRSRGQEGQPAASTPTVETSVRNNTPLPAGCELDEAVQVLTAFMHAFNHGDSVALQRFFPDEGVYPYADQRGFQWYSVTDQNGHFVTYDPAELPAYFAARHDQHERLKLRKLEVAGNWEPRVDFGVRLSRRADDISVHKVAGKAAMYCDDHTIFVWSMGQRVRP